MTKQPEDFTGRLEDIARFTIEAQGIGLSYQRQVSTNGGSGWADSTAEGYNTAAMRIDMRDYNDGYMYRCKITDSNGYKLTFPEIDIVVFQKFEAQET